MMGHPGRYGEKMLKGIDTLAICCWRPESVYQCQLERLREEYRVLSSPRETTAIANSSNSNVVIEPIPFVPPLRPGPVTCPRVDKPAHHQPKPLLAGEQPEWRVIGGDGVYTMTPL